MDDQPQPLSRSAYLERLRAGNESAGFAPTETARSVLEARYLLRDAAGMQAETADALIKRVSDHVASVEPEAERHDVAQLFCQMMRRGHFLPNSPTLMNAGVPGGQLAACFVLPVDDSIPAIFDAVKQMAMVQKTGGGTGFSFTRLRPQGDVVSTTKGISSGPLTFMEVFNAATDTIKQGGKRRGANMGVLEVHHPDILGFITAKADPSRLQNFNMSVGLTDEFMSALQHGTTYRLLSPRTREPMGELEAKRIFELISRCAWLSGEPGVLFMDRINADNPTPDLGRIESTNPCAELPLLPYESCNLGSINLSCFVANEAIDWPALGAATAGAVRFLDDVVDATAHPLPAVGEATLATRKIGLGVMGFADCLIRLGVSYLEDRALDLADEIMAFVARISRRTSEDLATERGPYPAFVPDAGAPSQPPPRRNATTNTIAPTGTLSILAGCSAGIEPLFAPAFRRRMLDGQEVDEVHPLFAEHLTHRHLLAPDLVSQVAAAGHARVPGIPEDLQRLFVTAHDVPASRHVEIQAAFQRHTDNAVSKTVNLPHDASVDDVAEVIRLAHRLGCKGITAYRDGSRAGQVLSSGQTPEQPEDSPKADPGPCQHCGVALTDYGSIQVCLRCGWSR